MNALVPVTSVLSMKPSRPERLIADMCSVADPLMVIYGTLKEGPQTHCCRWSMPDEIERQNLTNRQRLAMLPDDATLDRFVLKVTDALEVSTAAVAKAEIARLIGAYPNARPHDVETYVTAMLFDVRSTRVPDVVLVAACQALRRTLKFAPTIAELLEACDVILKHWRCAGFLRNKVRECRADFQKAITTGERLLANAHEEETLS